MAHPNSQLDANKNPQTRCSNCQTVFEVSHELLASGDTRVRCGECLSIFDAKSELRSQAELDREAERPESHVKKSTDAAVLAGLGNNAAALDVTYSDFDLFSEDADLPEIAYFDQTRETPSIDFDAIEMDDDETFSDTLFVHDATIDAAAGTASGSKGSTTSQHGGYANIDFVSDAESEDAPPEPLIFNYRDPEPEPTSTSTSTSEPALAESTQLVARGAIAAPESASIIVNADTEVATEPVKEKNSSVVSKSATAKLATEAPITPEDTVSPWWFRLFMLLLIGVLVAALYGYRTRPQLYNNPTLRPVLEAGCQLLRCEIPARVALDQLRMVKKNMYSHPNIAGALVVNVSFVNDADFDQQLPALHMVLLNRVGRTVAKRNFFPIEYMGSKANSSGGNAEFNGTIAAGQQLDVVLEVTDPGEDAQSFEFFFRQVR
jgi:predicted Zn finger-like uncharacterized protein